MYFRREVREVSSDIRADHGSQCRSELTVIHIKFAGLVSDPIILSLQLQLLPSHPDQVLCWSSQLCNLPVLHHFVWACPGLALPGRLALCRHPDSQSHHSSLVTVRITFLQSNSKSSGVAQCLAPLPWYQ